MAKGSSSTTSTKSAGRPMNYKADGIKICKCGDEKVAEQVQASLQSLGVINTALSGDSVVLNQADVAKPYREGTIAMIRDMATAATRIAKKLR